MFTKNGGPLVVTAAFLSLLAFSPVRGQVVGLALVTGLLYLPWWIHKAMRPDNPSMVVDPGQALPFFDLLFSLLFQTFFAVWHWSVFWWVPLLHIFRPGGCLQLRRALLLALLTYSVGAALFILTLDLASVAVVVNSWPRYLLPITPWAVLYVAANSSDRR